MNAFSPIHRITESATRHVNLCKTATNKQTSRWRSHVALAFLALLISVFAGIANAQSGSDLFGGPEILSPEEAFSPEVSSVTSDAITVEFTIAAGYYLYRDKSKFTLQTKDGKTLDSAIVGKTFSESTIFHDEYFGESAIFRDQGMATLAHAGAPSSESLELIVTYQGCADLGICYPPTKATFDITLPAADVIAAVDTQAIAPDNTPRSSSLINTDALADLFGSDNGFGNDQELLSPEQAYVPLIMSSKANQISLQWQIEPGYYLYRDKLNFSLIDAGDAKVVAADIDEGVMEHDEFFGNVAVLRNIANVSLDLNPAVSAAPTEALLLIKYQGCADIGVCFPPETIEVPVVFDDATLSVVGRTLSNATLDSGNSAGGGSVDVLASSLTTSPSTAATTTVAFDNGAAPQSEQDRITSLLASKGILIIIATFFGLGLLLAFTPCVLPMFPILSSLVVGQGDNVGTGKAFRLSLVYVLVMAVTYAIVGVLVGMSGYNIQAALQNPWILSAIALIFVLLSLSMFGLYELQIPVSWQQKLTSWSNNQRSGEYGGVAAMGFVSTLIVGPCVTAPLAGALLFIANTGNAVTGGIALFALGLGMGAPLLLVGTSAGTLVPKAGLWMDKVKHVFGILMLGMAIWMLSRVLPSEVTMGLFGILAVMSAVYLGATDTLNPDSSGWQRLGKGSGILVGFYGLALCLAAMAGTGSYSSPLRGFSGGVTNSANAGDAHEGLEFTRVKSVAGLQDVVANAKASGKPVMLDFYADWCVSCKEMEAFTFTDERVQDLLSNAILVQADVTKNDELDKELLKHFSLFGPPAIIFYDPDGQELPPARVVGFMSAKKFSAHIERFIGPAVVASR